MANVCYNTCFSRASKGFSGNQTMKQCGCEPAFTELLHIFGKALDTPTQRGHIQLGVRQYLHRMVVCMDAEILPFIPPVLTHLLKHPEARELSDFLPLLNQLVMKFKVGRSEKCVCVYVCVCVCVCGCVYGCVGVWMCVCGCVCVCVCMQVIVCGCVRGLCAWGHAQIIVFVCAFVFTCVSMYVFVEHAKAMELYGCPSLHTTDQNE